MTGPAVDLVGLAGAVGVLVDWEDVHGTPRRVEPATLLAVLEALEWPATSAAQRQDSLQRCMAERAQPRLRTALAGATLRIGPPDAAHAVWCDEEGRTTPARRDSAGGWHCPDRPGYWTLRVGADEHAVAIAPARCFSVADASGTPTPRRWGATLQVYAGRSRADAGIGDSDGVAAWCRRVHAAGGDALALSPLHAAGRIEPLFSPYSPSDRRFLEPVYTAPPPWVQADDVDNHAPMPPPDGLIDWAGAAAFKWARLSRWFEAMQDAPQDLQAALHQHQQAGGASLARFASFNAAALGQPDPALQCFAQWLSTRSWAQVQQRARARGMALGLVADLAVGFVPDGAEAAAAGDTALRGLVLGAPPDAFAPHGQVWGVSSYSPDGLRRTGFAPFIALLRAVMRDRGGVRIDHILGLQRLWVVPHGAGSGAGAYLRYPLDDLLNLLALESWRHRCIVIGEDLGVVPDGIRQRLAERGVMGMDVLAFSRASDGEFLPPNLWRTMAVATTGTHDLPTLAGWQRGEDIAVRARLANDSDDVTAAAMARRRQEAAQLAVAVGADQACPDTLHDAAIAFVATGPAPLALLPVEDALGLREQVNLPGTVAVYPNWRHRLPQPLPRHLLHAALRRFAAARGKED